MPKKAQPPSPPPLDRLEAWLYAVTVAGMWAGLLTPAVYARITQDAFISLKVFWVQAVVGLTFPAYVILAWRRSEFRPPRNLVTFAVLAHLATMALSIPFAEDRHRSWWGTLNRMDGVWSMLHFGAWTFMVAGIARTWSMWRRLLQTEVGVGLAAGCVAVLQVAFPNILGQATDVRISGLFGNPIFSAAFHSLTIGFVALLWIREKRPSPRLKMFYLATVLVSLAALVLAGSRGVLLGFATGAAVTLLVFGFWGRQRRIVVGAVAAIIAVGALYLAVAMLVAPRPELESFWSRHSNISHLFSIRDNAERLELWRVSLTGIGERPIFGWGQSNFESLIDSHYIPLQHCDATVGMDSAHNVVLQTLATAGVLGLAGFLLVWGAVFAAVVRAYRRSELERLPAALLVGLPTAHLTQALFNPESPSTLLLCYLLFALAMSLGRPTEAAFEPVPASRRRFGVLAFVVAETVGMAMVTLWTLLPAYASEHARLATNEFRQGRLAQAWNYARQAASVPTPYLEDQLTVDFQLLVRMTDSPERLFPAWRDLFALDRSLARRYFAHHKTPRFRVQYGLALHSVALATQDASLFRESEHELRDAVRDNPRRRDVAFALAAVLTERGRLDEAEAFYRQAVADEPQIGESLFYLGRFLWMNRDLDTEGWSLISKATRSKCSYFGFDFGELTLIATAFDHFGDKAGLASLMPLAESLPPTARPRHYLIFAKYLERAGMMAERDHILRLGARRAPEVASRAIPVLRGQGTLAETEAEAVPSNPPPGQP